MSEEKRILLVEDDPLVHDLLMRLLRSKGYMIDVVDTAAGAVAFLDCFGYALVITDWQLPDGDGLLIADAAAERGSKTFVISGYLPQMPRYRAEQHQAMMKPFLPPAIVAAVERSIGKAGVA